MSTPCTTNYKWIHYKVLHCLRNLTVECVLLSPFGMRSGSTSVLNMSMKITLWCKSRGIWLTVTHLPGKQNVEADKANKRFHNDTEWSLDTRV